MAKKKSLVTSKAFELDFALTFKLINYLEIPHIFLCVMHFVCRFRVDLKYFVDIYFP